MPPPQRSALAPLLLSHLSLHSPPSPGTEKAPVHHSRGCSGGLGSPSSSAGPGPSASPPLAPRCCACGFRPCTAAPVVFGSPLRTCGAVVPQDRDTHVWLLGEKGERSIRWSSESRSSWSEPVFSQGCKHLLRQLWVGLSVRICRKWLSWQWTHSSQ